MAPTEDANGRLVSGSWNGSYTPSPPLSPSDSEQSVEKLSQRDPLELSLSLQDLDNTCEIYFCGWDSTPTTTASNSVSVRHLAIPGASEDFRVSGKEGRGEEKYENCVKDWLKTGFNEIKKGKMRRDSDHEG